MKVRKGSGEEIPFVQGKEQQLCFAGAAVRDTPHPREEIPHTQGKRNPSKMVGVTRGRQKADKLKPYSQKTQFSSVQSLSHVQNFATHESQHARPPCPSPSPGVHSDSRPSSL